jgi:hypothetical protein
VIPNAAVDNELIFKMIAQRLQSENVGLIFDNPLTTFIGPVENNATESTIGIITTSSIANPLLTFTVNPNTASLLETWIAVWNTALAATFVQRSLTCISCNGAGICTLTQDFLNQNSGSVPGCGVSYNITGTTVNMGVAAPGNPTTVAWEFRITTLNSFGLISG